MALTAGERTAIEQRFNATREDRRKFLAMVLEARSRAAESDPNGIASLISALNIPWEDAVSLSRGDKSKLKLLNAQQRCAVIAVMGTRDLTEITFLEKGHRAAKAVGRLVAGTVADGSCFMISKSLLLTAHHAIRDEATARERFVQFDHEIDLGGKAPPSTQFALDPDQFFFTDCRPHLDFTIVALGAPGTGAVPPADFCPLPSKDEPHSLETFVNIIQHPGQSTKQVVFRENRLVCSPDKFLYYMADTRGGSSGSPIFNDDWQVVGMHRYGTSLGKLGLPNGCPYFDDVNQGVPANAIVKELTELLPELAGEKRDLLAEALSL
jgi:endonuclease G